MLKPYLVLREIPWESGVYFPTRDKKLYFFLGSAMGGLAGGLGLGVQGRRASTWKTGLRQGGRRGEKTQTLYQNRVGAGCPRKKSQHVLYTLHVLRQGVRVRRRNSGEKKKGKADNNGGSGSNTASMVVQHIELQVHASTCNKSLELNMLINK